MAGPGAGGVSGPCHLCIFIHHWAQDAPFGTPEGLGVVVPPTPALHIPYLAVPLKKGLQH
jgi:hypothetical protein